MSDKNKVVTFPSGSKSLLAQVDCDPGDCSGAKQMLTRRQLRQHYWQGYLSEGKATYQQRSVRYAAVAELLKSFWLRDNDLVVDVGAGRTHFDHFLRTAHNWMGRYLAVDGALDGTELNEWLPTTEAEFFVAIEVLEHLKRPIRLMDAMLAHATKAVVVTTPNPDVVDVLAMDRTHVTPLSVTDFNACGWKSEVVSLFGTPNDSILAWRGATR